MALVNDIGRYLKIDKIVGEVVYFDIYKTQETRLNPTEFDLVQKYEMPLPQGYDEVVADSNKTIKENNITAGYLAIKQDQMYKHWEDA